MTTFADREKEFEIRFKHDEELRFKATARRNRMLGLWAAQRLGLVDDAAEAYAKDIVATQFEAGGDQRVIDKLARRSRRPRSGHHSGPHRLRARALRRAGQAAADEGIGFRTAQTGRSPLTVTRLPERVCGQ